MSGSLVIPATLPDHFRKADGSKGATMDSLLSFELRSVDNLYHIDGDKKKLFVEFQETAVEYGKIEKSTIPALADIDLSSAQKRPIKFKFVKATHVQWGINFAGVVKVEHEDGAVIDVYVPGIRTYDIAGITGDPHASERIGGNCANTQTAITAVELIALKEGASVDDLGKIQTAVSGIVRCFHGRVALSKWMQRQLVEAVLEKKPVTPYPEFVQKQVDSGDLELDSNREHSKAFLESYRSGSPRLPVQYYKKVKAKDLAFLPDLLTSDQMKEFNQMTE